MGPFEVIVVFFTAWWIVFLPILGIGTHSQEEAGTVIPGTERGAPVKIGMLRKMLIAAGIAAAITFAIWLILHFGWLDFVTRPPTT